MEMAFTSVSKTSHHDLRLGFTLEAAKAEYRNIAEAQRDETRRPRRWRV